MCNGRAAYSSASSLRLPTPRLSLMTLADLPVIARISSIIIDKLGNLLSTTLKEFHRIIQTYPKDGLPKTSLRFEDLQSSRLTWEMRRWKDKKPEWTDEKESQLESNLDSESNFVWNDEGSEEVKSKKTRSFIPSRAETGREREGRARSNNPMGLHLCKLSAIIIQSIRVFIAAITSSQTILVLTIIGLWCNCSRRRLLL